MSDQTIIRSWPTPATEATADDIAAWYAPPTETELWTRVNFVSSLDGAATHDGLSGGLSDAADKRVFDLLRTLCDVVVVGAGTVRAEGYGAMRVDGQAQRRRVGAGLTPHPVFAIVSRSLRLDPSSPIFTDAPVRPIVVTAGAAPAQAKDAISAVADVLVCGAERVDTVGMLRALAERGLPRVHCEGGPHLFGTMLADGAVDELCLTLSPALEGGTARRITDGALPAAPSRMRLAHVLVAGDTVLLRYLRARP